MPPRLTWVLRADFEGNLHSWCEEIICCSSCKWMKQSPKITQAIKWREEKQWP